MTLQRQTATDHERVLTPQEVRQAIRHVWQGAGYRAIADELHVSIHRLRTLLKGRGVTPAIVRQRAIRAAMKLYQQGVELRSISLNTGIPVSTLYAHLARRRVDRMRRPRRNTVSRLSPEKAAKLQRALALYRRGTKIAEIEAETGLNRSTIYSYLCRKNISRVRRRI